jgi:hypothetical protein
MEDIVGFLCCDTAISLDFDEIKLKKLEEKLHNFS